MTELTDHELLTRFARTGEEAAFATLVTRHVNLVWSAARRFTGDDTLAGEVTQAVFIILAQKAGRLSAKTVLTGWLYQTARLTAANALKENRRRQQREHQAYMEATLTPNETNEAWQQLAPVLDEVMHGLRTADRDAVLLRYFENKSLADVGAALGVTEDAARVRVNRALEKLRFLLSKQGVVLGGTAIAGTVLVNSVQAAPVGLAAKIAATAMLAGTTFTTTAIVMTTMQKTLIILTIAASVGVGIYQAKEAAKARAEVQMLQPLAEQIQQLQMENNQATNTIAGLQEELATNDKNNLELLKLRGEVGLLQRATNELGELREANRQIVKEFNDLIQSQPTPEQISQAAFNRKHIQTINAAKFFNLTMRVLAADNNNIYPTNFNEEFVNQLTTVNLPSGSTKDMTNWLSTFEFMPGVTSAQLAEKFPNGIILREKVARQTPDGKWERVYSYADGSAWYQTSDDGNFDAFEQQHTIPPSNQ